MTRHKIKITPILLAVLLGACGCAGRTSTESTTTAASEPTTTTTAPIVSNGGSEAGFLPNDAWVTTETTQESVTTKSSSETPTTTPVTTTTTAQTAAAEPTTASADTAKSYYDGTITLNNNSINIKGTGLISKENTVTITAGGTYCISGTLNNGQLIIDAADNKKVTLVMNNAHITNEAACIEVLNTKKLVVMLEAGTANSLTSTGNLSDETVDANAAFYSKEDLTFEGAGILTVNSTHNGISSNDTLDIKGGTFIINADNNGLKGKDNIDIADADITIVSGNDGIKADNTEVTEDTLPGYILISSGNIKITSEGDGMHAAGTLTIENGTLDITSGGGSSNASKKSQNNKNFWGSTSSAADDSSSNSSYKALKASGDIIINGGTVTIDSADDAIHGNANLTINNGTFTISTGDDGMHADTNLVMNGGHVTINKSYEGIEAADITINGGYIWLTANDDGFNAAGGNDSSQSGGMFGGDRFNPMSATKNSLTFNDGYIYVNAAGDGIDSNGNITMTGGTLIVNGPTNSGNGTLDFGGSFNITGGSLIGAGSSGMLQTPGSASTVNSVSIVFTGTQTANSVIRITDEAGNEILTYSSPKTVQALLVTSPLLEKGKTYKIYTNGTYTGGTAVNGVYSGGTYSGTEYDTFTVSGAVTSVGKSSGGFGGGGMRPR